MELDFVLDFLQGVLLRQNVFLVKIPSHYEPIEDGGSKAILLYILIRESLSVIADQEVQFFEDFFVVKALFINF